MCETKFCYTLASLYVFGQKTLEVSWLIPEKMVQVTLLYKRMTKLLRLRTDQKRHHRNKKKKKA